MVGSIQATFLASVGRFLSWTDTKFRKYYRSVSIREGMLVTVDILVVVVDPSRYRLCCFFFWRTVLSHGVVCDYSVESKQSLAKLPNKHLHCNLFVGQTSAQSGFGML